MMKSSRGEASYYLCEYQSRDRETFGVEVCLPEKDGLQGLLASLRSMGRSEEFSRVASFVVADFPGNACIDDLEAIAQCANAAGLLNKVCLICPTSKRSTRAVISRLQSLGMRALLGGVGGDSRFADLTDYPIDGLVLDRELVAKAAGDPQAACLLEAIASFAVSLGVTTFASKCANQSELDMAASCGVAYQTLSDRPLPPLERQALRYRRDLPSPA